MNSLEVIKKELLKQKRLLDEKGIAVTVHNVNPSPSEITTALENLSFDFSQTTATEADVKMGKTFYSQNSELKTGTYDLSLLDDQQAKVRTLISGNGQIQIEFPEGITRIRKYAFCIAKSSGDTENAFSAHNLTIPDSITYIGERAFDNAYLPSSCTNIISEAFRGTKIEELYVYGGITSSSVYCFSSCTALKKVVIGGKIQSLPNYTFDGCSSLKETWLPNTFLSLSSSFFRGCTAMRLLYLTGEIPSPLYSTSFSNIKSASIFVPYLYYDAHYNNANMLAYGNTIGAYGTFNQNDVLPTGIEGYTFVWYASTDDFVAETNPITIAPQDGLMHARVTIIPSEEPEPASET